MKDIWQRIESQFRRQAPDELWRLTRPASQEEIEAFENLVGRPLPEDFRASYAIHNGVRGRVVPYGPDLDWLDFLLDLETITSDLETMRDLLEGGDFDGAESTPIGPVKPDWWNLGWIPFVGEGTGNYYCIDLDPAEGGNIGQVFDFDHERGPTKVLLPSFRAYLERYVSELESGVIRFDAENEEWIRES